MLNSTALPLIPVTFPHYQARQKYMHIFDAAKLWMPEFLEDYTPMVAQLLAAAGIKRGDIHMTVDEKVVKAGMSQRRPGPHVDGCFMPTSMSWGNGGGWNHYCNNVPVDRMHIIVAASVPGCKVWEGQFDGEPMDDGDLSHLKLGEGRVLPANEGFLLSPDCVHESLIFERDTERQFLRLAYKEAA